MRAWLGRLLFPALRSPEHGVREVGARYHARGELGIATPRLPWPECGTGECVISGEDVVNWQQEFAEMAGRTGRKR